MIGKVLHDDGQHTWIVLARDSQKPETVIDTNEYLVVSHGDALILDPSGSEVFPQVLAAVSEHLELSRITTFFASHQDPDVFSSLPLWMAVCPEAKIYLPWLWTGFLAHFGVEYVDTFVSIPDEGMPLPIGTRGLTLQIVPAHYCHAAGNYSVYDPHAKILFSGDIGSALLPPDHQGLFVEDFALHTTFMKGFHQRWMPSNEAKKAWIRQIRQLDVQMLCPQHGAILRGEQVGQFLDWLEALEVGTAIRSMGAPARV